MFSFYKISLILLQIPGTNAKSQDYAAGKFNTEDDVGSTTILRQEGNAIIATDHQINIAELTKNSDMPKALRNHHGGAEHEQQAKLFNSIVIHLEEQNHQIMKKLQTLQSQQTMVGNNDHQVNPSSIHENPSSFIHQQHPLDSCQNMQHQLQRLKGLVDNIFGANVLSEDLRKECTNASNSQDQKTDDPGRIDVVSVDDTGRKKHDSNSTLNNSKTGLTLLPNQRIESTPLCNYKTNPHLNKLRDNENGGNNKSY